MEGIQVFCQLEVHPTIQGEIIAIFKQPLLELVYCKVSNMTLGALFCFVLF